MQSNGLGGAERTLTFREGLIFDLETLSVSKANSKIEDTSSNHHNVRSLLGAQSDWRSAEIPVPRGREGKGLTHVLHNALRLKMRYGVDFVRLILGVPFTIVSIDIRRARNLKELCAQLSCDLAGCIA
jgi:hypothetical protein